MGKKDDPNFVETRGNEPHEPTGETRARVRQWAVAGFRQSIIARRLQITEPTLRKHYRLELDFALMDIISGSAGTLVNMANGRPAEVIDGIVVREEIKPDFQALKFLLSTKGRQYGFATTLNLTIDNASLIFNDANWDALTDDEFSEFVRLCDKIGIPISNPTGAEPARLAAPVEAVGRVVDGS